jgi:hypothetical protein
MAEFWCRTYGPRNPPTYEFRNPGLMALEFDFVFTEPFFEFLARHSGGPAQQGAKVYFLHTDTGAGTFTSLPLAAHIVSAVNSHTAAIFLVSIGGLDAGRRNPEEKA